MSLRIGQGRAQPPAGAGWVAYCAIAAGVLGLILLVHAFAAPAARAEYLGTPGRVAYVEHSSGFPLRMWEPAAAIRGGGANAGITTVDTRTWVPPTSDEVTLGQASTPVWSPDGTRIAYSRSIRANCPAPAKPGWHTAIFTYDLRNGRKSQITQPPKCTGSHVGSDTSPAWSGDGTKIAFVRTIGADEEDPLYPQRGVNQWWVPATGGSQTQGTRYTDNGVVVNLASIPKSNNLLAVTAEPGRLRFSLIPVTGGSPRPISSAPQRGVHDYDVAPDGKSFVYLGEPTSSGFRGIRESITGGIEARYDIDSVVNDLIRDSNTGNGPLHRGVLTLKDPNTGQSYRRCGLLERHEDDPNIDARSGRPDRLALPWCEALAGGVPYRTLLDVQAQELPVVFLPGFLGSVIKCGSREQWPGLPRPDLLGMRLDETGRKNAGCAASGPTGEAVATVLGSDIYDSVIKFMNANFPGRRGKVLGWDWRKAPQETLAILDKAIDDLLAQGKARDQGVKRVALYGHSYGGLLIRNYLEEHPEKVARVLTAGTPSWGSPKPIFPLALGVETPAFSVLDAILRPNSAVKELTRNLAGNYQLFPSDNFGTWLSIGGKPQDQTGVAGFVFRVGGNTALLRAARQFHADIYDGFFDNGQAIDVRAVTGVGLPTFGALNFILQPDGTAIVRPWYVNGDKTVPGTSATQGPIGTRTPLGDPINIQYTCGVGHVPLPGDRRVLQAYHRFLDYGATPRKLPAPCGFSGGELEFKPSEVLGQAPAAAVGDRATRRGGAGSPMSLDDAYVADMIELIRLPHQVLAVTSDRSPVTLEVSLKKNATFTYTPASDADGRGRTVAYGPVSGTVRIVASGAGGLPAVTANGRTIKPGAVPAPAVSFGKVRRSGRRVVARLRCPVSDVPCSGNAVVRRAKGRGLVSKRAKVRIPSGKSGKVRLKLTRRTLRTLARGRRLRARLVVRTTAPDRAPTQVTRRLRLRR